ncbi:MAG: aldo/keto reductase [Gorillibacterium sp.]|nr:aldo/keto reductase [Gorillibacterium sp.]
MKWIGIPGTGIQASCIALGTAELGTKLNRDESFRLLDAYADYGGNLLDTAQVYANWIPGEISLSEKTIGEWLHRKNGRERVILSTKGAHPDLKTMNISRLSRNEILKDLDDSLRHLRTDYIDLYWLHRDDPSLPVGEIMETLNEQIRAGKIVSAGCSNWLPGRIQEAQQYATGQGLQAFSASQIHWSMAVINSEVMTDPTIVSMDDAAYRFYLKAGMLVMAFSSQARGFFQKVADGGLERLPDWVKATYYNEATMGRLDRARRLAKELNISIGAVALGYLTSQPFAAVPIIGPQSMDQLADSMWAADVVLTSEQIAYLEG